MITKGEHHHSSGALACNILWFEAWEKARAPSEEGIKRLGH